MGLITLQFESGLLTKALSIAPKLLKTELRVELKNQLKEVRKVAKKEHRFKRKSGFLQRSIKQVIDNQLTGMVFLDTGIASYGPIVHEGHGKWSPDQFLYEALDKQKDDIRKGVGEAINRALKKAVLI